jgi:hypothetical protein
VVAALRSLHWPLPQAVLLPRTISPAIDHLAVENGRVVNLRLYGVDHLIAEQGSVAVDVKAFPGFRGVPGAGSALVALVGTDRSGTEEHRMTSHEPAARSLFRLAPVHLHQLQLAPVHLHQLQ